MSVEKCNRREKAVVIKAYMGLVVTHQYQLCFCYCITHSLSHSGAEQRFVSQAHKSLHVQTCT